MKTQKIKDTYTLYIVRHVGGAVSDKEGRVEERTRDNPQYAKEGLSTREQSSDSILSDILTRIVIR